MSNIQLKNVVALSSKSHCFIITRHIHMCTIVAYGTIHSLYSPSQNFLLMNVNDNEVNINLFTPAQDSYFLYKTFLQIRKFQKP